MTSKRNVDRKRSKLPRASDYTRQFRADWDAANRSGRYDMARVKQAMLELIAHDGPLGAEWLDHPLKGDWSGYRECHIGGDFLMIYQLSGTEPKEQIVFVRLGTHAALFE